MEKPSGYSPTPEQTKIKNEPESQITKFKKTFNNIFSRWQKPEGNNVLQNNKLAENKSKDDKDTEGSKKSIFRQLEKPTRREFVKIATKAIIGLTTGYVVKKVDSKLKCNT